MLGFPRNISLRQSALQFVGAHTGDWPQLEGGDHLVCTELPSDGRGLLPELLLQELVALHGDLGPHGATISSLLLELLAQLEGHRSALEGGLRLQGVGVSVPLQLHH